MKLHHIGKVVRDLKEAQKYYLDIFGLKPVDKPVIDPVQKVKVVKLSSGHGLEVTIELIQPINKDSPVYQFSQRGGGLHHLCFEVEDINKAVGELQAKGAIVLGKIVPGRAHQNKSTVWLYTSSRELIELVSDK